MNEFFFFKGIECGGRIAKFEEFICSFVYLFLSFQEVRKFYQDF